MRMDKLTTNFQLALQEAQSMAVGKDHQFIEPAHLMAAMLNQDNSAVANLYLRAGADVNVIKQKFKISLSVFQVCQVLQVRCMYPIR